MCNHEGGFRPVADKGTYYKYLFGIGIYLRLLPLLRIGKAIPMYLDQTTNTIDFRQVTTEIPLFKVNKLDIMYKKRQTRETNVNQIIIEGDREDIMKNLDISKNIGSMLSWKVFVFNFFKPEVG